MDALKGKRAVIFGVANERSVAWAIARRLHEEGAELAFTYAGEVLEKSRSPKASVRRSFFPAMSPETLR